MLWFISLIPRPPFSSTQTTAPRELSPRTQVCPETAGNQSLSLPHRPPHLLLFSFPPLPLLSSPPLSSLSGLQTDQDMEQKYIFFKKHVCIGLMFTKQQESGNMIYFSVAVFSVLNYVLFI